MSNAVHNPSHYQRGGMRCDQAMEAMLTPEQELGYWYGCIIKYVWRWPVKHRGLPGKIEDLEKAIECIKRLEGVAEGIYCDEEESDLVFCEHSGIIGAATPTAFHPDIDSAYEVIDDPISEHLTGTPAKPYANSAAELAEMGRAQIKKLQECVAHWEAKAEEQHYEEALAKVRDERGGHE